MKAVKKHELLFLRQVSTKDVMYNITNIINTDVCYI